MGAVLTVPIVAAALSAFGLLPWAALLLGALLVGIVFFAARERMAQALALPEGKGRVVFAAIGVLAAVRLWGLAWFMMDSAHAELSVLWFDPFYIRHSCFSSLYLSAKLAMEHAPNPYQSELYDTDLYKSFLGRFTMDEFLYPSPFMLLPRVGLAITKSFMTLRAAWFAIEAATFGAAVVIVAKWIGGENGRRALFLAPALFLATPVLLTLQIGNFQLAAIAMTMLALVAFESKKNVAGGALLGFALFKIFPGIVLIPLAIQRRWKAVAWTAGFSALYTALSVAWMGQTPLRQFLGYGLPRITKGEAWSFLELDIPIIHEVVAINQGIPGLALKLHDLGARIAMHDSVQRVSMVYSVIVVALAVVVGFRLARPSPPAPLPAARGEGGRRPGEGLDRLTRAQLWIALIALAALRSPFVPDTYALPPVLWLWSLVMPRFWEKPLGLALLWIPLSIVLPFEGPLAPIGSARLFLGFIVQSFALAFTGALLLPRSARPVTDLIQEPVQS
ncbi:MAG TPA: glycosyltransferase family 87 protein [Thermoanaerobaculia bacterium]|nr:glycosyltransferase family 87 protein [Thermoanaerobaculia bacterium]